MLEKFDKQVGNGLSRKPRWHPTKAGRSSIIQDVRAILKSKSYTLTLDNLYLGKVQQGLSVGGYVWTLTSWKMEEINVVGGTVCQTPGRCLYKSLLNDYQAAPLPRTKSPSGRVFNVQYHSLVGWIKFTWLVIKRRHFLYGSAHCNSTVAGVAILLLGISRAP